MVLALAGSSYGQGTQTKFFYNWDGTIDAADPTEGVDHSAGHINSVSTSFNSANNQLSYYANIGGAGSPQANGFWLAMSPGPNPKQQAGEIAIFYFDASQAGTPKLTVYGYNGVNGDNSWRTATATSPATRRRTGSHPRC